MVAAATRKTATAEIAMIVVDVINALLLMDGANVPIPGEPAPVLEMAPMSPTAVEATTNSRVTRRSMFQIAPAPLAAVV